MKLADLNAMTEMFPDNADLKFTLPGGLEISPVGLVSTIESKMLKKGELAPFPDDATLTLTMKFEF